MGRPDQPRNPDGTWRKRGGAVVVALALAGGVAATGGGIGGGTALPGGSAVRVKVDGGKTAAKGGKRAEAWKRMGLRQLRSRADDAANCVVHSYGDVRAYFARNPCRGLQRMLFVLADGGGAIVLSVSWVRMSDTTDARGLQRLADTDGTGNVAPIALSLVEAAGTTFTGRYYGSRRSASLVVIAEAEPVSGSPDPAFIDGVAEVAALLPPP